jgi:hypothetical protein
MPGGTLSATPGRLVQHFADQDMPRSARACSQVSAATGWLKQ